MYKSGFRKLLALWLLTILAMTLMFSASLTRAANEPTTSTSAPASSGPEKGLAAVYSDKLQGRKTASGRVYDRSKLTAAHKTLPFGTKIKVTNLKNQKSVVLRVNDRGPTQAERVLDITPRAARALGFSPKGMAEVEVEIAR